MSMLCLALLFCVGQVPEQAPSSPSKSSTALGKVEIYGDNSSQEFDLGRIAFGFRHRFTFDLVNKCNGPLRIEDIKLSCGCLTATSTAKELSVGEHASITVVVAAGEKSQVSKSVKIEGSCGDSKFLKHVYLRADVQPIYVLSSTEFDFVGDGSVEFTVKKNFGKFKWIKPSLKSDQLTISGDVQAEDVGVYRISPNKWQWKAGEISRSVPLEFGEGDAIAQVTLLTFKNPAAILVKPSIARPREVISNTRRAYRLYVGATPAITEAFLAKGKIAIVLKVKAGDEVGRVIPVVTGKVGSKLLVVDLEIEGGIHSELKGIWIDVPTNSVLAETVFVIES